MKTDVCHAQVRSPGRIRMAALASQKELSQRDHADFWAQCQPTAAGTKCKG